MVKWKNFTKQIKGEFKNEQAKNSVVKPTTLNCRKFVNFFCHFGGDWLGGLIPVIGTASELINEQILLVKKITFPRNETLIFQAQWKQVNGIQAHKF